MISKLLRNLYTKMENQKSNFLGNFISNKEIIKNATHLESFLIALESKLGFPETYKPLHAHNIYKIKP